MTIDGAVGAHDQPVGAKAPRKPLYRGRRFAQSFCTFQAVGIVLRAPDFGANRRGGATASFAITIGGDRDLDILMAGRDIPELQHRLRGVHPGLPITLVGSINPPRLHHRETAQFYADQVVPHLAPVESTSATRSAETPAAA